MAKWQTSQLSHASPSFPTDARLLWKPRPSIEWFFLSLWISVDYGLSTAMQPVYIPQKHKLLKEGYFREWSTCSLAICPLNVCLIWVIIWEMAIPQSSSHSWVMRDYRYENRLITIPHDSSLNTLHFTCWTECVSYISDIYRTIKTEGVYSILKSSKSSL